MSETKVRDKEVVGGGGGEVGSGASDASDASDADSDASSEDSSDQGFMEPITDGRTISLRLRDLNKHLVCDVCSGYFREAYTIVECLHSFCKSCIYKHFSEGDDRCPSCQLKLGGNPMTHIMIDRQLQGIVDVLLPDVVAADREAEEDYEARRTGGTKKRKTPSSRTETSSAKQTRTNSGKLEAKSPDGTVHIHLTPAKDVEPGQALPPLSKPYLKSSVHLQVRHLKKYLNLKLGSGAKEVSIICKGRIQGNEQAMQFIRASMRLLDEPLLALEYCKSI